MTSPQSPDRRRNLVLLRAGDSSIHESWLDEAEEPRNWDLIVNYFDDDPHIFRGGDWLRIDSKGLKMQGLHDLISSREDLIRRYDFIWLPDEDLRISCRAINRMFDVCRERQLKLAQPSITPDSYFSHPVTLHCPWFRLRYTAFVEIMAPCFSADALWMVLPTMNGVFSGWGLDFVWPKLLSSSEFAIAVIDEVQMTHTRPVGGGKFYKVVESTGRSAREEVHSIEKAYGISQRNYKIQGGILRSGRLTRNRILILGLYILGLLGSIPRMRVEKRFLTRIFMSAVWQQIKPHHRETVS